MGESGQGQNLRGHGLLFHSENVRILRGGRKIVILNVAGRGPCRGIQRIGDNIVCGLDYPMKMNCMTSSLILISIIKIM